MVKKVFYFFIKRDLDEVLRDLNKNEYVPEKGKPGFQNFLKFVEYAQGEQEMRLIEKELKKIIGSRGELILVK